MSIESEDHGDELQPRTGPETKEGFADRLKSLFRQTGMSTNEFERAHGLADATVSKYTTGKNVPSLKFVVALLEEAKVRTGLSDAVADRYYQDYGNLLRRLDDNGRGHNTYRLMFREFTLATEEVRAKQELLNLAEEKRRLDQEEADQATPDERKAVLRAASQQLAARQAALIEQHDAVQRELVQLRELRRQSGESDEAPYPGYQAADLPGGHAPHPVASPGAHAPQTLPAAPGEGTPRSRSLARPLLAAVVVLALGGFAIYRVTAPDGTKKDDSAPGGAAQKTSQPAQPSPSDARASTPSASRTPSAEQSKPLAVGDLNFTGSNWVQGTWTLGGHKYRRSLAWEKPCDQETHVVIPLPKPYQRFTAVVGMDEEKLNAQEREYPATFTVWADRNKDGNDDHDEAVATRGVTWDKPAAIDAPLNGAEQIILGIDMATCGGTPMVWGNPTVR